MINPLSPDVGRVEAGPRSGSRATGCAAGHHRHPQGAARRRPARSTRGARREPMNPDTIVLIHGFWVTPRSWEHWKAYYERQGYRVLTPAYPGFEVEVEAVNADPTPIENLHWPRHRGDRRAGAASDPDGPLRRRSVHSAHV